MWRNLEMLVKEKYESISLIMDRHLMEKMGIQLWRFWKEPEKKEQMGCDEQRKSKYSWVQFAASM